MWAAELTVDWVGSPGAGEETAPAVVLTWDSDRTRRPVCAPEKKITGKTGRMHGEMPVIKPPRKPMSTKVYMICIRSQTPAGWVVGM